MEFYVCNDANIGYFMDVVRNTVRISGDCWANVCWRRMGN
jgi:hypothetical protein